MKALTVGDLRRALADIPDVPDEAQIVMRATTEDEDDSTTDVDICCALVSAQIEHAHDEHDTLFLALDGYSGPDLEMDE